MSDEVWEFLKDLQMMFVGYHTPKFEAGAIEHKDSNIWELTDEQLEWAEFEEMLDLISYRITRMMKRKWAEDEKTKTLSKIADK